MIHSINNNSNQISTEHTLTQMALIKAVKNNDLLAVEFIFENDPTFKISCKGNEFIADLFKNFNEKIIDLMLDNGVVLSNSQINKQILESKSLDMLKFFINRSIKKHNHNDFVMQRKQTFNFITRKLFDDKIINKDKPSSAKLFEDKKDKFIDNLGYDTSWSTLYANLLLSAKSEDLDNIKPLIEYLEERFPSIVDASLFYDDNLLGVLISAPPNSQLHKDVLMRVNKEAWRSLFEDKFFNVSFWRSHKSLAFTKDNLDTLQSIIQQSNAISHIWKSNERSKEDQYIKWRLWYDKYLPDDIPVSQSPFYRKMKVASKVCPQNEIRDYYKHQGYGLHLLENIFNTYILKEELDSPNVAVKKEQSFMKNAIDKMCLTPSMYIKLFENSLMSKIDFKSLYEGRESIELFKDNPPDYTPMSFNHTLVSASSHLLVDMLKDDGKKDIIDDCLKDPYTKFLFIQNTTPQMLGKITQSLPHLLLDRDGFGNNIGYRYAMLNKLKTLASALALAKICPSWFIERNNEGRCINDILVYNSASKESIAKIDKFIIKSELKKDALMGVKIRSRTKHSSAKRKM